MPPSSQSRWETRKQRLKSFAQDRTTEAGGPGPILGGCYRQRGGLEGQSGRGTHQMQSQGTSESPGLREARPSEVLGRIGPMQSPGDSPSASRRRAEQQDS